MALDIANHPSVATLLGSLRSTSAFVGPYIALENGP